MVQETQGYLTAPYAAAIRPLAPGVGKHVGRPGPCKFRSTQTSSAPRLSCAVTAISALNQWITGINFLPQINECFPLVNNIGRSFAMLSSAEIAYELIDWEFLPVDATISGSKIWKSKLFRELKVSYYWVQLDLRDSLPVVAEHAVAVHIMKDWELFKDLDGCAASLTDNRGSVDYVQRSDVDAQSRIDAGTTIFSLFLRMPTCRITSIIKVKSNTRKNSTYAQASRGAKAHADRRMTRQLGESNLVDSLPNTTISTATKPAR